MVIHFVRYCLIWVPLPTGWVRPIAALRALAADTCFAVIAGGRSSSLNSRPRQHHGHWATANGAEGMTGVKGTADIATIGAQPTPRRPMQRLLPKA